MCTIARNSRQISIENKGRNETKLMVYVVNWDKTEYRGVLSSTGLVVA